MSRTLLLLIFALLMSVVTTTAGLSAEVTSVKPLLRDGFVMNGVDGNLIRSDSNDVWFFKLTSDVNDSRTPARGPQADVIKAGTKLELLPSSALEKMTADEKTRTNTAYRIWNSIVTQYKGSNFIFPGYFMPLSKTEKAEQKPSKEPQGGPQSREGLPTAEPNQIESMQPREQQLQLDEPNDILSMPQEIIKKLRARRERPTVSKQLPQGMARPTIADSNEASTGKSQSATKLPEAQSHPRDGLRRFARSTDSVYVDRTGFIVKKDDGQFVFVPDALGRNVQNISFHLLPCANLELTELKQAAEPDKVRFKIAGIITNYKGNNYLLLDKATRAYSYGNFGR
jgi:hypothetical protein